MTPLALIQNVIRVRVEKRLKMRLLAEKYSEGPKAAIFSKAPTASAIERIARRLEPQLRKRFLAAVEAVRDRVDLELLADAVERGQISDAMFAARIHEFPEKFGELAIDLRAGFVAGGSVAYDVIDGNKFKLNFDLINPHAVRYAANHLPKIVQRYMEDGRQAIRAVVNEAVSGRYTPREAAKLIKDSIGLHPRFENAVRNYHDDLVAEGVAGERLEAKVDRYREKLLKSRAMTIARTEIIQAEVSGQRALWNEAGQAGAIDRHTAQRKWVTNHEGETNRGNPTPCPICGPMNGQKVPFAGVYTHPDMGNVNVFGEPLNGPPLHPNCLCHEDLIL